MGGWDVYASHIHESPGDADSGSYAPLEMDADLEHRIEEGGSSLAIRQLRP